MRIVPSVVKQRLSEDLPVIVFCANPTPETRFVEMAALAGYHALWIDHEHQSFSDPEMVNLCLACRAGGIDAMIRVRKASRGSYFRALEMGAYGIMLPHCNEPEEAANCVREMKFPPVGNRSLDGIEPAAQFGWLPPDEYVEQANEETWLVVQIEEPEAVERVEEIAAVPGIDVLFIGPADLGLRYAGETDTHARVEEAIARTAAAARDNGLQWGLPVGSAASAAERIEQGARFLTYGSVFGLVFKGLQEAQREIAELL